MNPKRTSDDIVKHREDTIVQEIVIKRPAEKIFDALTKAEELVKWWRAEGKFQTTHMESDLRLSVESARDAQCGSADTSWRAFGASDCLINADRGHLSRKLAGQMDGNATQSLIITVFLGPYAGYMFFLKEATSCNPLG